MRHLVNDPGRGPQRGMVDHVKPRPASFVPVVAALLIAGCVSPPGNDASSMHRIDIATVYYPEEVYDENDEHGLAPGAPPAGAFFSMTAEPEDPVAEGCGGGTQALVEGTLLRQAPCYYEGNLSAAGTISFYIPQDAWMHLQLVVAGTTPVQPHGCERHYQSTVPGAWEEFEVTVEAAATVEIPFYIICQEWLD